MKGVVDPRVVHHRIRVREDEDTEPGHPHPAEHLETLFRKAHEEAVERLGQLRVGRSRIAVGHGDPAEFVEEGAGLYPAGFEGEKGTLLLILVEKAVGLDDSECLQPLDGLRAVKVDDDPAEVINHVFDPLYPMLFCLFLVFHCYNIRVSPSPSKFAERDSLCKINA